MLAVFMNNYVNPPLVPSKQRALLKIWPNCSSNQGVLFSLKYVTLHVRNTDPDLTTTRFLSSNQ